MKTFKLGLLVLGLLVLGGCAKNNPAYKDFKKSPCSCIKTVKEVKDV